MKSFFQQCGTDLIIYLPKELDHYYSEIIKKGADQMIQNRNIKQIIFDFQNTEFMDSSGIGMVIGRYKNIHFMGGQVQAVHVNPRVMKLLKISGIQKIITISCQTSDCSEER